MPIMFSVGGVNALAGVSHSVRAPSKQWRTLHEILGGGECQGPRKIYMHVRPMVGRSGGMLPQENFENYNP